MIGVNLILHVASAIAAIVLAMTLLRLKSQRDTLRHMLALAAHRNRKSVVMEPGRYVQKICTACGLPFQSEGTWMVVRKITLEPWRQLLSSQPVSLVLWQGQVGASESKSIEPTARVVIVVAAEQLHSTKPIENALATSLGDGIQVQILRELDYAANR